MRGMARPNVAHVMADFCHVILSAWRRALSSMNSQNTYCWQVFEGQDALAIPTLLSNETVLPVGSKASLNLIPPDILTGVSQSGANHDAVSETSVFNGYQNSIKGILTTPFTRDVAL